jgi:hypothetical protein
MHVEREAAVLIVIVETYSSEEPSQLKKFLLLSHHRRRHHLYQHTFCFLMIEIDVSSLWIVLQIDKVRGS